MSSTNGRHGAETGQRLSGVESRGSLFLAFNLRTYGNLPDAWLSDKLDRFSLLDASYWAKVAKLAEQGLFDAIFTGDGQAITNPTQQIADGLDRFVGWSAVLDSTTHLGVIVTGSTTYNDPYRLAERLLSLDHLSGGRIAWNVVTSHSPAAAANFGLEGSPDRDARYRRAGEFVRLVTELWRTAAEGGVVDHDGEHFSVHGGLRVPPSKQGRPPIIRASTSDAGRDLAGEFANGVFAADLTLEGAQENYRAIKSDARRFGREPDQLNYLSGLRLVIGSTEEEAQRKVDAIYEHGPERVADQVAWLSRLIGHDATSLDLDEPIPAELLAPERIAALPKDPDQSVGFRDSVLRLLRADPGLPLREHLVRTRFVGAGHSTFVGTPEQLAERLEHWYRAGAADGFVLAPDQTIETLPQLVEGLIPALQARGLFRREYASDTFRGHLGLR